MIIQQNGDNTVVFADGGLPEVMRWLESTAAKFEDGGPASRGNDFRGYESWGEVMKLCRDGWSEGADRIAKGFPRPAFSPENKRPHWSYDMAGDTPDVGRYLAGDPRHMRRRRVDHGRARVITLYIGMGVRASVSTKEFTNFGQAVCEMVDALENNGTRVELNQLTRSEHAGTGGGYAVTGWRVKEASDALDMASIAFTYMHPAAHRRIQFQMRARYFTSVGGSTTISYKDFPDAPANAIIFAGISDAAGKCTTLQGAREFLRQRINEGTGSELIAPEMLEHLQ
jgi:hypothetical protein